MSDGDALFAAIAASPEDDTSKLVTADWLDEHDKPELAAYMRLGVELARETYPLDSPEWQRFRELFERLQQDASGYPVLQLFGTLTQLAREQIEEDEEVYPVLAPPPVPVSVPPPPPPTYSPPPPPPKPPRSDTDRAAVIAGGWNASFTEEDSFEDRIRALERHGGPTQQWTAAHLRKMLNIPKQ